MMSEVLKACPWCAEMPNTDDGRNTDYGPRVWCANFPHCPVEPVAEGRTLADAITAWNTRTPAVATDEGVVEAARGVVQRQEELLRNSNPMAHNGLQNALDLAVAKLAAAISAMAHQP